MSVVLDGAGAPVHTPADPNRFEFDKEVSAIFPNMAQRAIPNFREAHWAHAAMLHEWMGPSTTILDVGASRGAFFEALSSTYPEAAKSPQAQWHALDNSLDMCEYLRRDFPFASVIHQDLTSDEFMACTNTYDIICVNYVLQFIPPHKQVEVMLKLFRMVNPGGVMIWGHKSKHYGKSGDAAHEQYIRFRMSKGYSRREIEDKTKALRGSMFPMNHDKLLHTMKLNFSEVTETFRFMMFSTIFAVK